MPAVPADRDEWMRRLGPLYPGAVALRQTTALRWPRGLEVTLDDAARSAPWMVLAGGGLGLAAWLTAWALRAAGAAPAIAGVVAVIALTVLGAALIERGLARVVDQLAAGSPALDSTELDADRERPRMPAVLALLALTALRVVGLLAIAMTSWLAVLIAAPLIGRWAALGLQRLGDVVDTPAARRRGLVVGEVSWSMLGVVTAIVAVIATVGLGWAGLLALGLAGGLGFGLGVLIQRRDDGLSADQLAAIAAACELVVVLVIATAAPATVSPWIAR